MIIMLIDDNNQCTGDFGGAGREVSLHSCYRSYEVMLMMMMMTLQHTLWGDAKKEYDVEYADDNDYEGLTNQLIKKKFRATHQQLNRAKPNGPKKWSSCWSLETNDQSRLTNYQKRTEITIWLTLVDIVRGITFISLEWYLPFLTVGSFWVLTGYKSFRVERELHNTGETGSGKDNLPSIDSQQEEDGVRTPAAAIREAEISVRTRAPVQCVR